MSVVQEQLAGTTNVLLEPQEGLCTALLFVEAPIAAGTGRRPRSPRPGYGRARRCRCRLADSGDVD